MRNITLLGTLFLAIFMMACQSEPAADQAEQTQQEAPQEEAKPANQAFGEAFTPESVLAFNDISSKLSEQDSVVLTVKGTVDEVCQAKGCWMTIQGGEEEGMMVRFKDYGFFMPKDISGREVIMNGKAFYRVTPVDELRHYAEDAGKTAEEIAAITEPKKELSFEADGVILLNE